VAERYRTPLPGLLAGFLEAGINRVLALDAGSTARLERLEGKLLRLELEGVGISLFLGFGFGQVRVSLEAPREPDTAVSGSPAALFAMLAPEEVSAWGLPGSGVSIQGNANLARDLGNVFSRLNPEWESHLAGLFGDTLGYQLASGLREGARGARKAARDTADMAARYFRDETGVLVKPDEVREFNSAVDRLRDAVERMDARVRKLRDAKS
jgi:ubiquinone biosynthesis protein UbiJ